jgi:hypothetical protein
VISGGLAPSTTSAAASATSAAGRSGDIGQLEFLRAFGEAGGLRYVDAVGYHPYSYPVPPQHEADWNAWSQLASTPTSFATVLRSLGFPRMKIWITEYGAPTDGPGLVATTSTYHLDQHRSPDHVTEALQAVMATESVRLAQQSPLVGALFWYTQTDAGTDAADRENFFGLRRSDGSPKPAYQALQKAIAEVTP